MRSTARAAAVLTWVAAAGGLAAEGDGPAPQAETKLLLSFEGEAEAGAVSTNGEKALSERHATHGRQALQLRFGAVSPRVEIALRPPADMRGYGYLKFDTFLVGAPVIFTLRMSDAAGKRYTSWYYLVNEGRQTVEYNLKGPEAEIDLGRVSLLTFWMEGSLPAASYLSEPSGREGTLELGPSSSVLYLDHVRLHRGPHDDSWMMPAGGVPPPGPPRGLIPNGDFELGFQGWGSWGTWEGGTYFFGSGRGACAHEGLASAAIHCSKPGRGGIFTDPPFTLPPGNYRLSFWCKGTGKGTRMFYQFEGKEAGNCIPEGRSSDRFAVPAEWTQKVFPVRVSSPPPPLRLYLYHVGDGTLYLDDVVLEPEGGAAPRGEDRLEGRPSVVTIRGRATLVNGKPFFPLGFYGDDPEALAGTPFNFITFHEITGTARVREDFDKCRKLGLMSQISLTGLARAHLPERAGVLARRFKNHPALFAWYLCDEPDHGRWNVPPPEIRLAHEILRKEDPNHPTWIVVMPWAPSNLYQYANTCSILASDVYPDLDKKPVDVLSIARAMDVMMRAHDGPVWMVPLSNPKATPGEQVAMTYLALVHGATGIIHWNLADARKDPNFWGLLVEIGREIQTLAPVLLGETAPEPVRVSDPRVHALLKRGPGGRHLLAVNASPEAAPGVALEVPGAKEGTASVLFEGRSVALREGRIADDFAGYQRHVYRLD